MLDGADEDAKPRDASRSAKDDRRPVPWTVKNVSIEQRDAINAAARRADMTVGQFIWDACEARIRDDRLPIGTAPERHTGAALVPVNEASLGQADELDKLSVIAVRLSSPDLKQTEPLRAVRRAVAALADRLRSV